MSRNVYSAFPGFDFDDIRRHVDGHSLAKECLRLASGIPRAAIDAARATTRAMAKQQAVVDAVAAAGCPPWAEKELSALGPHVDASALAGLRGRELDAVANGYADHAGLSGRLAREWADLAPANAVRSYQSDLESLRFVIDEPHREALSAIEALHRQLVVPHERTADQLVRAYAESTAAKAYADAQSQLSSLANDHVLAAHLAGRVASAAPQSFQNPLAEAASQLREQWAGLNAEIEARTAAALGKEVSEQVSALAAARAAWDPSWIAAAGLTATQGMALQLLRTTPTSKKRTKKSRRAKNRPAFPAAPSTFADSVSDQQTLDERRTESELFSPEWVSRDKQDARDELQKIALDVRASVVRVAQPMTIQAFKHSGETPFLELGAEIAAITNEFHRSHPTHAMDLLGTWQQLIEWDAILSAAQGPLHLGSSESLDGDDVGHVRECLFQLRFLLVLFEVTQNRTG